MKVIGEAPLAAGAVKPSSEVVRARKDPRRRGCHTVAQQLRCSISISISMAASDDCCTVDGDGERNPVGHGGVERQAPGDVRVIRSLSPGAASVVITGVSVGSFIFVPEITIEVLFVKVHVF
jgi:hypothetical protein